MEVFVWIGTNATKEERRNGMMYAQASAGHTAKHRTRPFGDTCTIILSTISFLFWFTPNCAQEFIDENENRPDWIPVTRVMQDRGEHLGDVTPRSVQR